MSFILTRRGFMKGLSWGWWVCRLISVCESHLDCPVMVQCPHFWISMPLSPWQSSQDCSVFVSSLSICLTPLFLFRNRDQAETSQCHNSSNQSVSCNKRNKTLKVKHCWLLYNTKVPLYNFVIICRHSYMVLFPQSLGLLSLSQPLLVRWELFETC